MLENMRRCDIGEIERRILPHENDVKIGEITNLPGAKISAFLFFILEFQRMSCRRNPATARRRFHAQMPGCIMKQFIAALCCSARNIERAVAGFVEPLERIHLNGDTQFFHSGLQASIICTGQRHGATSITSKRKVCRLKWGWRARKSPAARSSLSR